MEDLRLYFQESLRETVDTHSIDLSDAIISYLSSLLTRNLSYSENRLLFEMYVEASRAITKVDRLTKYRQLGDQALFVSGLFSEHLDKKVAGIKYYIEMGSSAYYSVSTLQRENKVFDELSCKFPDCVVLLNEFSAENKVLSSKDIVKIYERWSVTHSHVLYRKMITAGMLPVKIEE